MVEWWSRKVRCRGWRLKSNGYQVVGCKQRSRSRRQATFKHYATHGAPSVAKVRFLSFWLATLNRCWI